MSLTRARWRLSLTLLCLVASTFQSSLALIHVHTASPQTFVSSALQSPDQAPDHTNTTRENAACPLCQILLAGGGLPGAPFEVSAREVALRAHVLLDQVSASCIAAVSYAWQSRGPPLI
jgi:hypothetical protein